MANRRFSLRSLCSSSALLALSACTLSVCALPACTLEVPTEVSGELDVNESKGVFGAPDGTAQLGTGDLTVLMVVDRSGSMIDAWEGVPKWQIARNALDQAIVGVEEELTIGALLFPMEGGCTVAALNEPGQLPFQRGDAFQERWVTSDVSFPSGSTPLGEAFRQAHLAVMQAKELGLLEQRFRVVVITDGQPTCGEDPEALVAQADLWREMGVEVRVMGLPGSAAAAALLNRIAGVELFEDPTTGEVIVPDAGSRWDEGDEHAPGYVAPPSGEDVDDSLHAVVR